jgi:hypothetical protein
MELAALSVALLEAPADAPVLDEGKADALQDAHLDLLASLHVRGILLVAGPFISPPGREFRGMCLLRLPPIRFWNCLARIHSFKRATLGCESWTGRFPPGRCRSRPPSSLIPKLSFDRSVFRRDPQRNDGL